MHGLCNGRAPAFANALMLGREETTSTNARLWSNEGVSGKRLGFVVSHSAASATERDSFKAVSSTKAVGFDAFLVARYGTIRISRQLACQVLRPLNVLLRLRRGLGEPCHWGEQDSI